MEYTVVLKILSTLKEIEMIEMKMMNGHDLDGRYGSFKDIIERADNEKCIRHKLKMILFRSMKLFDHDRDGILNLRETKKLLRCLGFRTNEEQVFVMNT